MKCHRRSASEHNHKIDEWNIIKRCRDTQDENSYLLNKIPPMFV